MVSLEEYIESKISDVEAAGGTVLDFTVKAITLSEYEVIYYIKNADNTTSIETKKYRKVGINNVIEI